MPQSKIESKWNFPAHESSLNPLIGTTYLRAPCLFDPPPCFFDPPACFFDLPPCFFTPHLVFFCFFKPSCLAEVSIKWDLIPIRESLGFQFLGLGTLLEPSWNPAGTWLETALKSCWNLAGTFLEASWNLVISGTLLEHCRNRYCKVDIYISLGFLWGFCSVSCRV